MKKFMFVVVLYETSPPDSSTLRSLSEHRSLLEEREIQVLVIDNTPGLKQQSLTIAPGTEYISLGENLGLPNAYQIAFHAAMEHGFQYLVLLDQDSDVSRNYIVALDELAHQEARSVAIWCPRVLCCGKPISPYLLNIFGWPNYDASDHSERIYGINSFSVINLQFIANIGGFDHFYWLDCLDSWLYEKAHYLGWSVKRFNVTVQHSLSVASGCVSVFRMKNIAFYESCFVVEYGSATRIAGTILRLIARALRRGEGNSSRDYLVYFWEIIRGMRIGLHRRSKRGH